MSIKATVRNYEITIAPRITPVIPNVQIRYEGKGFGRMDGLPGGQGQWESLVFGAPRGEAMCRFEFHATAVPVAAAPGKPPVVPARKIEVGFIQNILSAEREATYSRPSGAPIVTPAIFRVIRDGTLVGAGLLDCGTTAPPWFQGTVEDMHIRMQGPPDPNSNHASVHAHDNPRWTLPIELSTQLHGAGTLKHVKIKDTFQLYAVAREGTNYFPIASIKWGTDIEFTVTPGPRTEGQAPAGELTGRLVWTDPAWSSPVIHRPITTDPRVNEVLTDRFVA
jgi:hypothetical protein